MTVDSSSSLSVAVALEPPTVISGMPALPVKPPRPGLVSATMMLVVPVSPPSICSWSALDSGQSKKTLRPSRLPVPPEKPPDVVTTSVLKLPSTPWRRSSRPPAFLKLLRTLKVRLPATFSTPLLVKLLARLLEKLELTRSLGSRPELKVPALSTVSRPAPPKLNLQGVTPQALTLITPPTPLVKLSAPGPKAEVQDVFQVPELLKVLGPVEPERLIVPLISPPR